MPNAYERPLQENSIWNAAIPTTASYVTVPDLASKAVGLSSWLPYNGSSVPLYQASATTQQVNLLYNPNTWWQVYSGAWQNVNNTADVEQSIRSTSSVDFPYPYHTYVSQSGTQFRLEGDYNPIPASTGSAPRFYIPAGVKPTANPDGHMVVYQPDGRVLETFGTVVLSDGTIVAQTYNVTDPALNGDGYQNGVTASMVPVYAGLITQDDINRGSIDHAIKLVLPAGLLDASYVYPALSFDRGALTENPAYSGTVPMGGHLAISHDVDLGTMGLQSSIGHMIAAAAQKYGFIVTDRGGSGVTLMTEADVTTPALDDWTSQLDADLHKILGATKRVTLDGADLLTGGAHDDVYYAGAGNDRVSGLGGADLLYGEAGQDTLDGGTGNDKLSGGLGADLFVIRSGDGNDTILDFGGGWGQGDRIDLSGTAFTSFSNLQTAAVQVNSDVALTIAGGQTLVLKNVSKSMLTSQDFILATPTPTATPAPSPTPAPTPAPASATTQVVVNAFGTAAGGVNAHFNLLIDGKKVGEAMSGTAAKDYSFTVDVTADQAHKVQIQYDNDGKAGGHDRNLFVNSVTINGKAMQPTASIVTYDKGALDGKDVAAGQSSMWWNGTLVVSADKSYFPALKAAAAMLESEQQIFVHNHHAVPAEHDPVATVIPMEPLVHFDMVDHVTASLSHFELA